MAERILGSVDISIHNDLEFETVTVTVNGRFKQDGQRRTDSIALTGDEVEAVMPGLMSKLREHMAAGGIRLRRPIRLRLRSKLMTL